MFTCILRSQHKSTIVPTYRETKINIVMGDDGLMMAYVDCGVRKGLGFGIGRTAVTSTRLRNHLVSGFIQPWTKHTCIFFPVKGGTPALHSALWHKYVDLRLRAHLWDKVYLALLIWIVVIV